MDRITNAVGFGIGAIITTAAAANIVKQINRFPRPYKKRKKKRR